MDARQVKAEQIVAGGRITRGNGCWLVPSQTGEARHKVTLDGLFPSCTCADFELTERVCKHMLAVKRWVEKEAAGENPATPNRVTEPESIPPTPPRKTYKQPWHEYNLAQTREKDHVQELLADLCAGLPGTTDRKGTKGGRPNVSPRDAVYAAVYKVYTGFSARRFMSDFRDAHGKGYLTRPLCHNSVLKAMESEALTPILKELVSESALPLAAVEKDFAVDSSGFCTSRFYKWFDHKWGGERSEHVWVKLHICSGTLTNCVTAADILEMHSGDAAQLPGLIDKTAEGFKIGNVLADKAYPSLKNFEAVAKHGGNLYAPFRAKTTGAVGGLFAKAFHYFSFNREEFLQKYHKRSNVESTFSGIKRTMGDSVRSKTDVAMRNEVYCKLIAWNLTCLVHAIYELGVVPMFWQDPDQGEPRDVIRFPTAG